MAAIPTITLNDGAAIPQLGLGVYRVPADETAGLVRDALESGFRHVDTARSYGIEEGVGRGLRVAGGPREDVWITTKLDGGEHGYDRSRRALDASLRRLGTDHVDLFLIHHPGDTEDGDVETWRAFAAMQAEGRVRSVGVSNVDAARIEHLIAETGLVPAVNQIRLNPLTPKHEEQEYHRARGIAIEAWGPLREGRLLTERRVQRLAAARGCTPAQVVLRWHLQRGLVVFPKTSSRARLAENLAAADLELTEDEMATIDGLGALRRAVTGKR